MARVRQHIDTSELDAARAGLKEKLALRFGAGDGDVVAAIERLIDACIENKEQRRYG